MEINETTFPIEFDWEGELVPPPTGVFAPRGEELPRVKIGRPATWRDSSGVFGENWTPPAQDKHYGLVRFAFSLRPKRGQTVRSAEFTVYLEAYDGGERPIFFDLFPLAVTEEQTGERYAEINPTLKFAEEAEASLFKAGTRVNLREMTPVISAYGVGESTASWEFTAHSAHPFTGSQLVYAIVEWSREISGVRSTMELSAEITTSLGPLRGLLPRTEEAPAPQPTHRLF